MSGPNAEGQLPTSDQLLDYYKQMFRTHRGDPELCPVDKVKDCEHFHLAHLRLLSAGVDTNDL